MRCVESASVAAPQSRTRARRSFARMSVRSVPHVMPRWTTFVPTAGENWFLDPVGAQPLGRPSRKSKVGCAFFGCWDSGQGSCRSALALDCRTVRQRRLTSSFRLASPARNLPTLSCILTLFPNHRMSFISSLAQPQMALSALKSRLQSGRFTNPRFRPGVSRYGPHRLTPVRRRVVPSHIQWPGVPLAQSAQEGRRGFGVAVTLQLHPLHIPGLQTHRPVVAGLFATPRTAEVHQGRLSPQRPLPPQLRVRPEVGLIGKEYPGFGPLGLLPQNGILCHEGLLPGLISLDQTFHRFLRHSERTPHRALTRNI